MLEDLVNKCETELKDIFDQIDKNTLENLKDTICQRYKEIIDAFLGKINQNKMLLNNPDILDIYLKSKIYQIKGGNRDVFAYYNKKYKILVPEKNQRLV